MKFLYFVVSAVLCADPEERPEERRQSFRAARDVFSRQTDKAAVPPTPADASSRIRNEIRELREKEEARVEALYAERRAAALARAAAHPVAEAPSVVEVTAGAAATAPDATPAVEVTAAVAEAPPAAADVPEAANTGSKFIGRVSKAVVDCGGSCISFLGQMVPSKETAGRLLEAATRVGARSIARNLADNPNAPVILSVLAQSFLDPTTGGDDDYE